MRLLWNNHAYELSDAQQAHLIGLFRDKIEQEYNKLESTWRLAAKAASRGILQFLEKKAREQAGPDAALAMRPGKGQDPVLHLFDVGEKLLEDLLQHVILTFEIDPEKRTITRFTASAQRKNSSQDGGQVDTDGDIGIRENDGLKVS